jgi:tetratricopeptide (TPR) repeat protein
MARREAQALCVEGDVFVQQEKWDEAIMAFRAAAEKDPEMSAAWYSIAMAECEKNGNQPCEAAYKPLKRCIELNPNHARAQCGLGIVLLYVRKDDARAEEHLQTAIRLAPNYADAHRGLAGVLERRDALDEAIREMLEYVRLSGDHDGSGKAHAAALLEKKKKAGGRAAKPDAEAQARFPPSRRRARAPAPRPRVTSYD